MSEDKFFSMTVQTLRRLPYYLQYLKGLAEDGIDIVSAPEAAESLRLNEVLVRKDFALASSEKGKPKVGFSVLGLIRDIEHKLGYHNITDAVLVGVGSLGKALFSYEGFEKCGLRIVAGFDSDENIVGSEINGKKVFSADKLTEMCRRMSIRIGIIAVPSVQAQTVCDKLIEGGILAIWNFAPIKLTMPKDILVHNENIVTSLTILSKQLEEKLYNRK
jgi:redox-sensing transcriptional repressor